MDTTSKTGSIQKFCRGAAGANVSGELLIQNGTSYGYTTGTDCTGFARDKNGFTSDCCTCCCNFKGQSLQCTSSRSVCEAAAATPFPSAVPSSSPTQKPSFSGRPSSRPSHVPSSAPSRIPSSGSTQMPSFTPRPSSRPNQMPSSGSSSRPSQIPSSGPSSRPSQMPSSGPSSRPSMTPSMRPTKTTSTAILSSAVQSSNMVAIQTQELSRFPLISQV